MPGLPPSLTLIGALARGTFEPSSYPRGATLQATLDVHMEIIFLEKEMLTRPRCGLNRALKLKVTDTVQLRFCYCFSLYANVQLVKCDIVTAFIYCKLHNNRLSLREMSLLPFSIWRCYVTKGLY